MHIDEVTQRLAKRFSIDNLSTDAYGVCRVLFDTVEVGLQTVSDSIDPAETTLPSSPDNGTIAVHPDGSGDEPRFLILTTHIGQVPDHRHELLEALLAANFFGDGPGGSNLSRGQDGNVNLTRRLSALNLDFEDLLSALENFVNYAEYWQLKLNAEHTNAAPPRAQPHPDYMRV